MAAPKSRHLTVTIPQDFSFITNPEGVLETISDLMVAVHEPNKINSLIFDHFHMKQHDLAAEEVLGTIASDLDAAYEIAPRELRLRGRYPGDDAARRFVRGAGLVKLLKIRTEELTPDETQRLEVFFTHRRQGTEEIVYGQPDRKSTEVRRFVDHVGKCLRRNGRELTQHGIESLSMYAGEILANAEEHTERGEWILAGFLDDSTDGHITEIAVVSFGLTFAESFLSRLPASSFPMQQILPYLEAHSQRNFFTRTWEPDDLVTLVALQGGISSKSLSMESTRGKGTIDLITFFEGIHRECAAGSSTVCEMAILSGRTHIRFDGSYRLKTDSTGRDVIAFNERNSLEEPPDSRFIKRLSGKFPGTVISIRFALQPSQVKEVAS